MNQTPRSKAMRTESTLNSTCWSYSPDKRLQLSGKYSHEQSPLLSERKESEEKTKCIGKLNV